jgi:molybdopterin converting factor small subunit
MRIRVLAFAHLRELLEQADLDVELPSGATAGDAWSELARRRPGIAPARASARFARNGAIVAADEPLIDGDELALLSPVGGG